MSYRDNEFYKSVGDGEKTLIPEAQSAELTLSDEWKSAAADAPPTCETEDTLASDLLAEKKGGVRKIAKMIKLTAAVVVTSVVAVGSLSIGGASARGSFRAPNQEWPSITYTINEVEDSAHTTIYDNVATKANNVQFSVDGFAYRLEDPTESIFFMWASSLGEEARLLVHDRQAGHSYTVVISKTPFGAERTDAENAYGTISSTTGSLLYIEAISHFYKNTGAKINTSAELSNLMHRLVVRSRITEAYEGEWGNLLIGDKLYSKLDEGWSGLETCNGKDWDYHVEFSCCYKDWSTLELTDFIESAEVNGIKWNIYRQNGFLPDAEKDAYGIDTLWFEAEIEGENCVLGLSEHVLFDYCNAVLGISDIMDVDDVTPEIAVAIAEGALAHFYIAPASWRW